MYLLKRENWWVWLLLLIFTSGYSIILYGAMFNIYEKEAWYAKWYIWVIGFILIIPFYVMFFVLLIGVLTKTAAKLDVKGKDYYLSPYIWIILLIIPILGWIILSILYLYINIAILVKLHDGNGEKYIS